MSTDAGHSAASRRRLLFQSARFDVLLWAILIALGGTSLGLAYVPLRPFNLAVGLAIATIQIGIIGMFFMELRHARPLILLTAGAAFIFVLVMFGFALNDLFTRL